jgi:hypothetical protein
MKKTILVLMVVMLSSMNTASGTMIFTGDYETGNLNQWGYHTPCLDTDSQNSGSYPISSYPRYQILSGSQARQGNYAVKFTAYPGDGCAVSYNDRIGVEQSNIASASTSPDLYFGFSYKIDSAFNLASNEWVSIVSTAPWWENQNYQTTGGVGFGLSFQFAATRYLYYNYIDGTPPKILVNFPAYADLSPLKLGVWHDFVYHIKYSHTTSGQKQIWHKLSTDANWALIYENLNIITDFTVGEDPTQNAIYLQQTIYRGLGDITPPTNIQSVYYDNTHVATTKQEIFDTFGTTLPISPPYPPSITSWGNTKTNNQSTSFDLNSGQSVTFNVAANQTITTWTWKENGVNAGTNSASYTTSFTAGGNKTVSVYGTNSYGTTPTKTWVISVPLIVGNYPKIGLGGVAFGLSNAIFDHTTVNKGDNKVTVGLFADNCNDLTSDWSNGWTCNNKVLTPASTQSRTITRQNTSLYNDVTLFAKINEYALDTWNMNLRFHDSRDSAWKGYSLLRSGTGTNLVFENYVTTWDTIASTTYPRTTNTPYYYIFDIVGSNLKAYVSTGYFSLASPAMAISNSSWTNGNYFTVSSTNATFDDIRLIKSGQSYGSIKLYYDAGANNQTNSLRINATTPANTNYSVSYRQKNTGNWILIGTGYAGNRTLNIPGTKYQDTEINLTLFGNGTAFPDIETIEFSKLNYTIYDMDNNGVVDKNDLILMYQHLNEVVTVNNAKYNLNGDGLVNLYDITLASQHIGQKT